MIRVMIADDHDVVRKGLRSLLETHADLRVVAEAGDADEVLQRVPDARPDVLILDIGMPAGGGLRVLRGLADSVQPVRTLVLTMHDDPAYIRSAFGAGALGYVLKSARGADLVEAVRAVARGERIADPATTRTVLGEVYAGIAPERTLDQAGLTVRELEVLRLLAAGHTNAEVGARLGISVKTVETHRARIARKIGARSRADLVRFAHREGLLTDEL